MNRRKSKGAPNAHTKNTIYSNDTHKVTTRTKAGSTHHTLPQSEGWEDSHGVKSVRHPAESIPGSSNLQGGSKRPKAAQRARKSRAPIVEPDSEQDDDDDVPLARLRKSAKGATDNHTEHSSSQARARGESAKKAASSARKRGKAAARGNKDLTSDRTHQDVEEKEDGTKGTRGRATKTKGKSSKVDDGGADVQDSHGLTKGAGRKQEGKGKKKALPTDDDEPLAEVALKKSSKRRAASGKKGKGVAKAVQLDEVDLEEFGEADEPDNPPPRSTRHVTSKHSASKHDEENAHEDGSHSHLTKRKRPHLYIPSDSESEDDMPLRKRKEIPRGDEVPLAQTSERSAKRVKFDDMQEPEPVEAAEPRQQGKSRRKPKTPRTSKKKAPPKEDVQQPKDTEGQEDEIEDSSSKSRARAKSSAKPRPKSAKAPPSNLKKTGADQKSQSKKHGQTQNPAVASTTPHEQDNQEEAEIVKVPNPSRKRHKAAEEDIAETGGEDGDGHADNHPAKRRRKSSDDERDEEAVVEHRHQVRTGATKPSSRRNKSEHQPHGIGLKATSRALKENRKAAKPAKNKSKGKGKATAAAVPVRKPMPRLSLFPDPSMALDSEDEIDFLR